MTTMTTREYEDRRRKKHGGAAATNRIWIAKNRDKYLAHKTVENAIKCGTMKKQPCERCGTDKLVHAHHDDYSKRREVMWLCPLHHQARHRELQSPSPGRSASLSPGATGATVHEATAPSSSFTTDAHSPWNLRVHPYPDKYEHCTGDVRSEKQSVRGERQVVSG